MKTKLIFIFIFITFKLSSQNEFNNWFFGIGNGLNFSTPIPTLITGSPMSQTEGVASVSDASGNLLFYTNGVVIYDRFNNVMSNGTGLLGDPSSTQSSIIVKKPNSNSIYYVFTADNDAELNGIRWSEVDMTLNSGLGAVTINKNILLQTPSCEKLCAVRHCDGERIWVISHDWNSNVFRAWLIDGINPIGSITSWSSVGPVIGGAVTQSGYGQLKASSDGKRLGACYYGLTSGGANRIEVYDFDNLTGFVSSPITLATNIIGPYGCEFSQSGRMFYATTNQGRLFQWDLCSSNIVGSRFEIVNAGPFFGSLQMANNGKIYTGRGNQPRLSCINFPEVYGFGCGFVLNAVTLNGNAMFGLPNFPSYYLQPYIYPISVTQPTCNQFCLTYPSPLVICGSDNTSYQWVFEDGTTQNGLTVCKTLTNNQTVLFRIIRPCDTDSIFIPIDVTNGNVTISPIYH
jgi:hypothetical protein